MPDAECRATSVCSRLKVVRIIIKYFLIMTNNIIFSFIINNSHKSLLVTNFYYFIFIGKIIKITTNIYDVYSF